MKKLGTVISSILILICAVQVFADHPDITGPEWRDLFEPDLSNTVRPGGVWTFNDGVLTASEDKTLWSSRVYDNFILDLEFKVAHETNSGVFIYGSDLVNWIPNSIEIQIADDHSEKWGQADPKWQCGAIFGHLQASKQMVKKPGEWNRFTITANGSNIKVVLNGEQVIDMDMREWTSGTKNPDGSDIPPWLNTPLAELPTFGHIGFQGKHAGAPIWFRNIRVRELR